MERQHLVKQGFNDRQKEIDLKQEISIPRRSGSLRGAPRPLCTPGPGSDPCTPRRWSPASSWPRHILRSIERIGQRLHPRPQEMTSGRTPFFPSMTFSSAVVVKYFVPPILIPLALTTFRSSKAPKMAVASSCESCIHEGQGGQSRFKPESRQLLTVTCFDAQMPPPVPTIAPACTLPDPMRLLST